jgi:hypothetical protein
LVFRISARALAHSNLAHVVHNSSLLKRNVRAWMMVFTRSSSEFSYVRVSTSLTADPVIFSNSLDSLRADRLGGAPSQMYRGISAFVDGNVDVAVPVSFPFSESDIAE